MYFARLELTSIGSFTRILVTLSLPFYFIVIFMCSRLPCYVYDIAKTSHQYHHFFLQKHYFGIAIINVFNSKSLGKRLAYNKLFPYICICICNRTNMRRTHQQNLLLSAFNFHKTKFFKYFF